MKSKKDILITIACLAFILANLAAVGPAGRSRAQEAACLSNMMKWGQVFQAYVANNNGFFHSREIGTTEGYSQLWIYTYEPYYGDRKMLCCPAAGNPHRKYDIFGTWGGPCYHWPCLEDDYYGSYGFNRWVVDMRSGEENKSEYWRRAGVKSASNVPVLVDCMYVNLYWDDDDQPPEFEDDFSAPGIGQACINRHDGGVNVCFMDFSARKVGLKELWTLKGNRNFDTCNDYTICGHGGDAEACADFWDAAAPWMSEFPEY